MGLVVSAYDGNEDGNENRLLFWLRLDQWSLHQAALIIADVNPDMANFDKHFNFVHLLTFKGEEFPDCDSYGLPIVESEDDFGRLWYVGSNKLKWFSQRYNDLHRIFSNSNSEEFMTPSHWINKAISKQIIIPWLDFAIRRKICAYDTDINGNRYLYLVNGQMVDALASQVVDKILPVSNLGNYPIELDFALKAWQAISTCEGKGKPKARIKKWLDENTNLSNEAKERICIVANWDKSGGATKT